MDIEDDAPCISIMMPTTKAKSPHMQFYKGNLLTCISEAYFLRTSTLNTNILPQKFNCDYGKRLLEHNLKENNCINIC